MTLDSGISPAQHLAALALVAGDLAVRALRTRLLLPVPFRKALAINTCGDALATVTPARIGGEPIRFAGYLRAGLASPRVLAAFATETVADIVLLAVAAPILLATLASSHWQAIVAMFTGSVHRPRWFLAGVIALPLFGGTALVTRLWPQVAARGRAFLVESWLRFRESSPRAVAGVFACTVVSFVARASVLPVLLSQLPGIEPGTMILLASGALYLQLLTPIPGGLGLVELAAVIGLRDVVPLDQQAAVIGVWRVYTFVAGASVGALLLLRERVRPVADHSPSR